MISTTGRRHGSATLWLGTGLLVVLGTAAALPWLFTSADPRACDLARSLGPPSAQAWFGYDLQGCDLFAATLYGARTSLGVTLLVTAATVLVALGPGTIAGYVGGRTDTVISRVTDVWAGIPLVLGGVMLLSGTDERGPLLFAGVLALFGWPPMVRVLRASVAQETRRDHVLAARALGAGHTRVLLRHVLPGSLRPLLVFASAYGGIVVGAEATLTVAGVGLRRPIQSWGIQLYEGQARMGQAPHLLVPGLFVIAAVAGFVLLGEALRDRGSPTT